MISVIILAAGYSRRMGQPKQLLTLGKSTILQQTVKKYLDSHAGEIIVVVGYQEQRVRQLLEGHSLKIVFNADYPSGMASSIATGIREMDKKSQGIMIALGDLPLVSTQTINELISAFLSGNKGIVLPTYQGMSGHPVIFSIAYRQELLKLRGDKGARKVIDDHREDVLEVPVDDEGILADIDTKEQYDRISVNFSPDKPKG